MGRNPSRWRWYCDMGESVKFRGILDPSDLRLGTRLVGLGGYIGAIGPQ